MPEERREAALADARARYGEGPSEGYLAFVDGEPVGTATARFTDAGVVLCSQEPRYGALAQGPTSRRPFRLGLASRFTDPRDLHAEATFDGAPRT